jgi:hypothetical protein
MGTVRQVIRLLLYEYDVLRLRGTGQLPESFLRVTRYLVESRGTLLMVRRCHWCSKTNGTRKTLLF